jgi:hypothetical protein
MRVDRRLARGMLAFAALAGCGCVSQDLSFKSITFARATRDTVFDAANRVVATHYSGAWIHADAASGRIETDPVEEVLGAEARHQQVYVVVTELPPDRVKVELMATLARLVVDPDRSPPSEWRVYASDVIVEGRLLDEIAGRVLSVDDDAEVVAHDLPAAAHPR